MPPVLKAVHKYNNYKAHHGSKLYPLPYHFYWQKLVNFLVINVHYLKNASSNKMKTLSYTSIKGSFNKFCKNNNYCKSKINQLVLNVNKIIFEAYVLANLHIIWLLDEDKEILPLNQKFFQHVLAQRSWFLLMRNITRHYDLWDTKLGIGITLIPF